MSLDRCHYWLTAGRQCSRRKGTEACGDFCCQHARKVRARLESGLPLWGQGWAQTQEAVQRFKAQHNIVEPIWYVGLHTADA